MYTLCVHTQSSQYFVPLASYTWQLLFSFWPCHQKQESRLKVMEVANSISILGISKVKLYLSKWHNPISHAASSNTQHFKHDQVYCDKDHPKIHKSNNTEKCAQDDYAYGFRRCSYWHHSSSRPSSRQPTSACASYMSIRSTSFSVSESTAKM